jgi:hypothetical protein
MKRFFLTFGISMTLGIVVIGILNALNLKPLNIFGDDPNSNAMIFGILYLIAGGILFGSGVMTNKIRLDQLSHYFQKGYADDMNNQLARFPIALALCISGILFILLYLVLNRLT